MKPTVNHITPEQFEQIMDAIPKLNLRKFAIEDVQMMMKISYWLALRIGETLKLNADDFDFDRNEAWLGKTKTEVGAKATIPLRFRAELIVYLEGKTGPLFPGWKYITVLKWLEKLGKELGVKAWIKKQEETGEKTKTHIFRKSIGKDMFYGEFGSKAPLTFISKTLRHGGKNPLGTTIKYLDIGNEEVKDWWKDQEENAS